MNSKLLNNYSFSANQEKEQNLASNVWGKCDKWFFMSIYLSDTFDPNDDLKTHIELTNQKTEHFTEFIMNLSEEICESLNRR